MSLYVLFTGPPFPPRLIYLPCPPLTPWLVPLTPQPPWPLLAPETQCPLHPSLLFCFPPDCGGNIIVTLVEI